METVEVVLHHFRDEKGRTFAQDAIENPSAVPYAADGRALVTRILLHSALFDLKETSEALKGLRGAELAKGLSLTLLGEASGKDLRYFTDAEEAHWLQHQPPPDGRCARVTWPGPQRANRDARRSHA